VLGGFIVIGGKLVGNEKELERLVNTGSAFERMLVYINS
jgi:hypothetical protein